MHTHTHTHTHIHTHTHACMHTHTFLFEFSLMVVACFSSLHLMTQRGPLCFAVTPPFWFFLLSLSLTFLSCLFWKSSLSQCYVARNVCKAGLLHYWTVHKIKQDCVSSTSSFLFENVLLSVPFLQIHHFQTCMKYQWTPNPFCYLRLYLCTQILTCQHSRIQHYPRCVYIRRIKNEHSF